MKAPISGGLSARHHGEVNRIGFLLAVACFVEATLWADVTILSPANGAVFPAYSTVTIEVQPDFKDGDNSVRYGIMGNQFFPENMIAVSRTPPYSLTVSNLPAGTHRYAAWTSDRSPRAYVQIVVTNPPIHTGPFSIVELHIQPEAINNHGVIVGNSSGYAFTWDRGIIRWVPMPNNNKGGATAINDAGQITGYLYATNEGTMIQKAYLFSNGATLPIEIPGADSSMGLSISPRGDVMRVMLGAGGFSRSGFIYTAEGGLITNDVPLSAMNSWGTYVGADDSPSQAVFGGPAVDQFLSHQLGPLRLPSGANDINDAGQVAAWGTALNDGRHFHQDAYLYSNYKVIQLTSGFYHVAYAYALNRWGQVIGEVTATLHGPRGAFIGYGQKRHFLWSEGGGTDLTAAVASESSWDLENVVDINDHGQIVGTPRSGAGGLLLNPRPRVLETRMHGGELSMRVHERPGTTLKLQSSVDFKTWTTVLTNSAGPAVRDLTIASDEEGVFRFFRVINDEHYRNEVVGL